MLHMDGKWVVALVSVWLAVCAALTCNSGDLSSVCVISADQSFTSDQVLLGDSLRVEAPISCTGCSFMITMTGYITSNSVITASTVMLKSANTSIEVLGQIIVGQNGTCSIETSQGIVSGQIEGSYISVHASDFLFVSGNISASGYGYGYNSGPGAGLPGLASRPGGGGGYGGYGGDSSDLNNNGGLTYGSSILPAELGSGGGNSSIDTYAGGSGGGFINITAGTFNLSGFILANGQDGQSAISTLKPHGAGAGSGGSIDIIVGSMNFVNTQARVMAEGGNGGGGFKGGSCGGSGGGGRIWVNATTPLTRASGNVMSVDGGFFCSMAGGSGSLKVACPPGYAPDLGYLYQYACVVCGTGSYSDDGEDCYDCPSGTYSNVTGATSPDTCQDCPEGTYGSGAAQCYPCAAGRYNNLTRQLSCPSCAAGSFSANPGSTQCTLCPAGSSALQGSQKCTNCTGGTIAPNPGSGKCLTCWAGSEASANRTQCDICPPNQFSNGLYPVCEDCSTGYFSPANSSSCQYCPAGTYTMNGANGSHCEPCAAGTASNSGSYSCSACLPGYVATAPGMAACLACAQNSYSSEDHTHCAKCPPDTYSNYASSKCYKCEDLSGTLCLDLDGSSSSDDFPKPPINFKAFSIALPVSIVGFVIILGLLIAFCIWRSEKRKARARSHYEAPMTSYSPSPSPSSSSAPPPPFYSASYPLTLAPSYSSPPASPTYPPPSSPSYPPAKQVVDDPTAVYPPPQHYAAAPSAPPVSEASSSALNASGSNVCVVCMERPKEVVFLPCGHVATCQACAAHVIDSGHPNCVMCRAPIQSTTKIFM